MRRTIETIFAAFLLFAVYFHTARGQGTLGLADGFTSFNNSVFAVQLVKDSQTLYSLSPIGSTFDFIPSDMMTLRQNNSNYHLGDVTFRARKVGTTTWISGDTSAARKKLTPNPISPISTTTGTFASANLAPTLPAGSLLDITRRWVSDADGIELLFDVHNAQGEAVEIGALGAALEFNNIFTSRTAAQVNALCSLTDPYIGADAGFVQVTPLLGTLPPLLVVPANAGSPLEGWRFLEESTQGGAGYQSQTFEGLYAWEFHTLAYAEDEWAGVTPWNAPTSALLPPGATRTYGLRLRLAPAIQAIEHTLRANGRPVAVALPGYVLPGDQVGKVFLSYPAAVRSVGVEPEGAVDVVANNDTDAGSGGGGWVGYTITPAGGWGRARVSVVYADGTTQTLHYYLTDGGTQAVSKLGNFLTTAQWFDDPSDPFGRSPSVISYDRSVDAPVVNDARAWIAGLSDEGGAGSWLAAAMKEYVQPAAAEVAKLERFVNQTLWGSIQNFNYTVKMSVFFYQPALAPSYPYPPSIDWGNWWSWNEASAFATGRGYDYVHVTAAYWALYRVARNYPALVTIRSWEWYINQAVNTIKAMMSPGVGYTTDGLMGETVFRFLLDDLNREGLTANASFVQAQMRTRWKGWSTERYPFGSEMAWDSTGQEGVYLWSKFFNDTTTATNALNSIIAYQPLIPHWGYNGNARRYWDNIYAGKLMRYERQIHHYGSGLNALPLLSAFESSPTDYFLLRVGYAGSSGPLSNIDQGGFAAASFHSFADTLAWDAYSGDYGPNFSGFSMGMGTTIINHPDFGWQAFGGIVNSTSPAVTVQIRDPVRRRVFIAPIAALLTLDAGAFSEVSYTPSTQTVVVTITPAPDGATGAASAPNARLLLSQTAAISGVGVLQPTTTVPVDAGAFVLNYTKGVASVTLKAKAASVRP